MHAAKRAANTFQSSAQRTPHFCIMMIGFHKQRTILCKCSKNAVIARQCAHWRTPGWPLLPRTQPSSLHVIANQSADWCGNPYPYLRGNSPSGNPFLLHRPILRKYSETCSLWDTDFRVGAKHLRCTLFAQTQAPAQPLRSLGSLRVATKGLRRALLAQNQVAAQLLRSLASAASGGRSKATGGAPLRPASLRSSQ